MASEITENDLPQPTHFNREKWLDFDLEMVWMYDRMSFLYQKLLGYPTNIRAALKTDEPKAVALHNDVLRIKKEIVDRKLMFPKGVFQLIKCHRDGEAIIIDEGNHPELHFPRQQESPFLSLTDYVSTKEDSIGLFVVTAGREILKYAKKLENNGLYKDAFIIQSLSISTSEAMAEMIHHKIRSMWGFEPFPFEGDRAPRRYRGNRYSFGYPSCPNMEDQQIIWDLLHPEEIDVELTESYMMDPEATVSAIVFHHPEAKYFNV